MPLSAFGGDNNNNACWDVPIHAENAEVSANRIDAKIIKKLGKSILLLEMSSQWMKIERQGNGENHEVRATSP